MLDESPRKPKFLYKFRSLAQSDYDMENLVSIVGKNELKLSAVISRPILTHRFHPILTHPC